MKRPRFDPRRFVYQILMWSQAFIPVLALFASLASAVRTFVAIREIYGASVTEPVAIAVSFFFTIAVEGAIFTLSLAQERQKIKWRMAHKKRHLTTAVTLWQALKVRAGVLPAPSYDQLPEGDTRLTLMIGMAFSFALVSNFYIGALALVQTTGSATIQEVITGLLERPARVQLDFLIDVASVLFPPFMALVAGHQTARFASEFANAIQRQQNPPVQGERRSRRASVQAERSSVQENVQVERAAEQVNDPQKRPRVRVHEWMNEHPEIRNQHEIARQTGASVATVNNVFKERLTPGANHGSNGHGTQPTEDEP